MSVYVCECLCVCPRPAVEEVVNRDILVEGAGVQAAADLNVLPGQETHGRTVLLLKHVQLQRRTQQQEVVICKQNTTSTNGSPAFFHVTRKDQIMADN